VKSTSTSVPQLRGARTFSIEEVKKMTNSFSEANGIGNAGHGKVYRGTLPSGQLVAAKRSQQGSLEFRTEIELLSRVHHKNVVSLVGFCLDQGEQMLVYEYVPNGTLKESLTGRSVDLRCSCPISTRPMYVDARSDLLNGQASPACVWTGGAGSGWCSARPRASPTCTSSPTRRSCTATSSPATSSSTTGSTPRSPTLASPSR
jgi:hypothetical protein